MIACRLDELLLLRLMCCPKICINEKKGRNDKDKPIEYDHEGGVNSKECEGKRPVYMRSGLKGKPRGQRDRGRGRNIFPNCFDFFKHQTKSTICHQFNSKAPRA